MNSTISNYGVKIPNPTSSVKNFKNTLEVSSVSKKKPTLTSYIKTIIPSRNNGSFIKTFNNV